VFVIDQRSYHGQAAVLLRQLCEVFEQAGPFVVLALAACLERQQDGPGQQRALELIGIDVVKIDSLGEALPYCRTLSFASLC